MMKLPPMWFLGGPPSFYTLTCLPRIMTMTFKRSDFAKFDLSVGKSPLPTLQIDRNMRWLKLYWAFAGKSTQDKRYSGEPAVESHRIIVHDYLPEARGWRVTQ